MKMEMLQPSGSFKSRGVGNYCLKALEKHRANGLPEPMKFYISSGGNAGLAAVSAATALGQECVVIVPETVTEFMRNKIQVAGGVVFAHGESWQEADDFTRELLAADPTGVYCSPFDHPDIWEGNSTMVEEIISELDGMAPDAIIASVGGGGMFAGIMQGLQRNGMEDVPVVAVETEGAHSLHAALKAGELVSLPKISSIATSLGARRVAPEAFRLGQQGNVISTVLTDEQAAAACVKLLDDERLCVEVACGVSVAVLYERLLPKLLPNLTPESQVVLVICGGRCNITSIHRISLTQAQEAMSTSRPSAHIGRSTCLGVERLWYNCIEKALRIFFVFH